MHEEKTGLSIIYTGKEPHPCACGCGRRIKQFGMAVIPKGTIGLGRLFRPECYRSRVVGYATG
jgi:hypothetical protein